MSATDYARYDAPTTMCTHPPAIVLVCVPDAPEPSLALKDSWHVCVDLACRSFVPNDIALGGAAKRLIILTGPNMGGKSTLLRQTALTVILAQMGAHVSARSCAMTVVDKIFTRVGANDRIMSGQSTFFVELNETSTILKHSTPRSLVILDELGRGTATWDGAAIASSTAHYLAHTVRACAAFPPVIQHLRQHRSAA